MRIAQNHGRAARIGGLGFEIIKINAIVAVLVQYQLVVENGQTIVLGGKGERVIDRPLDNDLISRSGDGSQGRVDGRHHAVGQAHPRRVDMEIMTMLHPIEKSCEVVFSGVIVTEYVMGGRLDESLDYFRSRFEFHVCHGQGHHIFAVLTHLFHDLMPFGGRRVMTLKNRIEIVRGMLCQNHCFSFFTTGENKPDPS